MRRSIEFCRWQASEWERQAHRRTPSLVGKPHIAEGIAAYAFEQAADEREREKQWTVHWSSIHQRAKLVLDDLLSGQDSTFDEKEDGVGSVNITIEEESDDSDADYDASDVDT